MVVRAKTLPRDEARETVGPVSRAKTNTIPPVGVTSFTREYMDYFAPLFEDPATPHQARAPEHGHSAPAAHAGVSAGDGNCRQLSESVSANVK